MESMGEKEKERLCHITEGQDNGTQRAGVGTVTEEDITPEEGTGLTRLGDAGVTDVGKT